VSLHAHQDNRSFTGHLTEDAAPALWRLLVGQRSPDRSGQEHRQQGAQRHAFSPCPYQEVYHMNHSWIDRVLVARLVVPALIAVVATACAGGASSAPGASAPASSQSSAAGSASSPADSASLPAGSTSSASVAIGVATSPTLGSYLTAPDGNTLYTLSSDPMNQSTCADQCAAAWPPLLVTPNTMIAQPTGVTGTFGTITRADGNGQVTLDGHPLYEFVKDTAPGQTNGEGIVAFGGTWHVAKAG
jgi:predicted lipoprotein with Yx(FWY)xxD motif